MTDYLCLSGSGSGNKKYMVRLLTYLPGTPVAKIAAPTQLLYDIGKLAASLDKALTEVSEFLFWLHRFHSHFISPLCFLLFSVTFPDFKTEVGDFRA